MASNVMITVDGTDYALAANEDKPHPDLQRLWEAWHSQDRVEVHLAGSGARILAIDFSRVGSFATHDEGGSSAELW